MHFDDIEPLAIRNGVLALGDAPSLRVENNRLVIRNGRLPGSGSGADYRSGEDNVLSLTHAETARGALRHVIMIGDAGWVSNAAHQWLRDTGVGFSLLDPNGNPMVCSGPSAPDRPRLRRQQAIIGSGIMPKAAAAITGGLLRAKLRAQSEVARLLGHDDAGGEIAGLAEAIVGERDSARILMAEAKAGKLYWRCFRDLPVRFARRTPTWYDNVGRRRTDIPETWLRFGPRASLLTGQAVEGEQSGELLPQFLLRAGKGRDDRRAARRVARPRPWTFPP